MAKNGFKLIIHGQLWEAKEKRGKKKEGSGVELMANPHHSTLTSTLTQGMNDPPDATTV